MAFDGSGTFVRLFNWVQDKTNAINITASRVDAEENGIAAGLSLCVTRDGQGKMSADFLPATDNTLNLGSATFRWTSLNGDSIANGSAVLTMTGVSGSVTGTATWARVGKLAALFVPAINGTSTSTAMTLTGVPAAIQPATASCVLALPAMQNNGAGVNNVDCVIAPGTGIILFRLASSSTGFTAANAKGTGSGFAVAYPLT
jgi:hypothetical protein